MKSFNVNMIIDDIVERESEKKGLNEEQETVLMDWLYQSADRHMRTISLEIIDGEITIIPSASPLTILDILEKTFK